MKLPITRGDCKDGPRPCLHACRYRLEGAESCALDVADRGEELSSEAVGLLTGLSKSGAEETEARALRKIQVALWLRADASRPRRPGPSMTRTEAATKRGQEVEAQIVALLANGPMTAHDIIERTGQSIRQAREWLYRLTRSGALVTGDSVRAGHRAVTWSLPKGEAAE